MGVNGDGRIFVGAKKRFGQHFLCDPNILGKIASAVEAPFGALVLEIGPGKGALTSRLVQRGFRVIAWEIDPALALEVGRCHPEVLVVNGDALNIDYAPLQRAGLAAVAGNLPYNVASPLIWNFAERAGKVHQAVFLIQKEVAERIVAPTGCKAYGRLTVWVRSFCEVRMLFSVSPKVFLPPPKVWSAVVALSPRAPAEPFSPARLSQLLHVCFGMRRKQMGTILSRQGWSAALALLEDSGYGLRCRPEDLPPEVFQKLSGTLDFGEKILF